MKRITRPIELTPQKLAELRFRYRPGGSGPLGCMRQIVQLVEQIAADRNIDLDEIEWTYRATDFRGTVHETKLMKGLNEVEK